MLWDKPSRPDRARDGERSAACVRKGVCQIAATERPSLWVETLVVEGHMDVILVAGGHRQIGVSLRGGHGPPLEVWSMRRLRSMYNGLTWTHYQAFWTDSHDKMKYAANPAVIFSEDWQCRNG